MRYFCRLFASSSKYRSLHAAKDDSARGTTAIELSRGVTVLELESLCLCRGGGQVSVLIDFIVVFSSVVSPS